jgi:predicted HicB family RNase H-like nuclease
MATTPKLTTTRRQISFVAKFLDFLEVCKEQGIEPRRHYSGKSNLRIPPELHEKLAMAAEAQGKSINSLAQEALQRSVPA